jgi:phage gp36-like protein
MAYCNREDIETRLGGDDLNALADHDGDGIADSTVVDQAIASAQAVIDSYLGTKFSVPVAPVPDVLKTRAVNLAVYFLKLGRDSVSEDVRRQYENDVTWLREVVAGAVTLGVEPTPAESSGSPSVRYDTQPRIFGRDDPL